MGYLWFLESCMYSGCIIYNKNFIYVYLISNLGWITDCLTGLISGPLINIAFFGRKNSTLISLFITVVCSAFFHYCFVYEYSEAILLFFNAVARFFLNLVYVIMFVYTAELFPTVIRAKAIFICTGLKGFGGMFSSYLIEFHFYYVFLIFAILSAIAFLFICCIHETLGVPLPQEIPEIEMENRQKQLASIPNNEKQL